MKATEATTAVSESHEFASRPALAEALAARVAAALAEAIRTRGAASIAVSGGSTPKAFFANLSTADIDWSKVTVTLVDERAVPPSHERSNQRLVVTQLLQNRAAAAGFVPLWSVPMDGARLVDLADAAIGRIGRPFDVVVLGMGLDGHTASFFPGGSALAEATDPAATRSVMSMEAEGAGEPRLTLTLPLLVEAPLLVLHIEGKDKLQVLTEALGPGPETALPVRAVLRHARHPVNIYWAP
ncbi:6-phosphogluconolactonase [Hoeflea marina]|uniref:6-phosphogluconolactonase n=1 Tax=Hoeflea marina TaxID=274592 RepID=A0A317PM51_9HYPH|nr:6-phosphogluconolactonase [Hoeflea marina]PWW01351.1 6-phosphogluconolactonase [Hoeflea marina]